MKKYNFIKEYKNGMKIEKREVPVSVSNSTMAYMQRYNFDLPISHMYIVWHNDSPIKNYGSEAQAVNYIETSSK